MPEGHDTTIEVSNIMSFVLYTQILKQSVLKPASPGITFQRRIYNILNLKIFNHISSMLQTLTANTNENFKKDVQLLLVYEIHSFTEKKVIVFGYR